MGLEGMGLEAFTCEKFDNSIGSFISRESQSDRPGQTSHAEYG